MNRHVELLLLIIALALIASFLADAIGVRESTRILWIVATGWVNVYIAKRLMGWRP